MNELARKLDRWLVQYGNWIIRWRWPVLLTTILLVAAAGFGAQNLIFKNDYRIFFSKENPQLQAFEELQNSYTKNDVVLFVLTPESGNVIEPETLAAIRRLTDDAWQLPYSLRVDSISNFQHTRAEADDLLVGDLVPEDATLDAAELADIREIALTEPLLVDRLISDTADVTAVAVTFQVPEKSPMEMPEIATASRALAADIEAAYPHIDVRLTGNIMLNTAFFESSMQDNSTLVPIMFGIIILTMLLMVRSFSATITTVLVIVLSIVAAMGLAGWAGIFLSPPSASAPTIITTLAVADAVHIFITLFARMRDGLSKNDALVDSIRLNMQPVFLTSLTTAIGFLTMNFSDAPPFRDLGNITAMGVFFAWILSVTTLPALISILPMRGRASEDRLTAWMDRLGNWVVAQRKPVTIVFAVVSLAILAGIPMNRLSDEFIRYFDTRVEFRRDSDYTNEHLTGVYQIQYSLPAGESGAIAEPEYLRLLGEFSDWLRAQPETIHVMTLSDVFQRLNKNMHGDDPDWYRLPQDRELAAQYLLLYEMSLPYGLDLNNQINVDKSATQVIVSIEELDSVAIREYTARAENWLATNAPSLMTHGASPAIMFSHISERNINSMLGGTLIGIFVIALILIIALRDLRIGLFSLIPNLLPAGLAFGLWGLMVGQVNMAVSIVASMSLGIVVDDTIHFLSKYLRARRQLGKNAEEAIIYAFHNVGTALVVTTTILVAGFMVLAQSSFQVNSSMALMTAAAILLALIADFLLLPPMLLWLDEHRKHHDERQKGEA